VADHDALLLSHHGALTVGATLAEALGRMEQVEHSARILLAAHQFGGVRPLPPARVDELRALREQMRASRPASAAAPGQTE
jgi:L-fuculose-phosphate aldolase